MPKSTPAIVRKIDSLSALDVGCDLWLVPELQASAWARKMDWYLNFQMARAQAKEAAVLSPELKNIITNWDFDPPPSGIQDPSQASLMIMSSRLLPNMQTVLVPHRPQTKQADWIERCHQVWLGLKRPSLRLFLPRGLSGDEFEREWSRHAGRSAIEIVTDDLLS